MPVLSPAAVDAIFELFDAHELTGSIDRTTERIEVENPAWNFSAIVGAAAVATGGYRFVIQSSDRVNRRWLPGTARLRRFPL